MRIVLKLFCAFLGTIGFAILFDVPKKYFIPGGLVGTFGWIVYMIADPFIGSAYACFFASFTVTAIARIGAVKFKCPVSIFLIPGIFPLIPGGGIFYTTYYITIGELGNASSEGMNALKACFAIVAGITFAYITKKQLAPQALLMKKRKCDNIK